MQCVRKLSILNFCAHNEGSKGFHHVIKMKSFYSLTDRRLCGLHFNGCVRESIKTAQEDNHGKRKVDPISGTKVQHMVRTSDARGRDIS